MRYLLASSTLALLATTISAHSWIEHLVKIDPKTGLFTGELGYGRNYIPRSSPNFKDDNLVYRLPGDGQKNSEDIKQLGKRDAGSDDYNTKGISSTMAMCKANQNKQTQAAGYPRLKAAPGDALAIIYLENGHVTLPQAGRPENRGTVYVYGTMKYKESTPFLSVFKKWTADGSGGDKTGRLLATIAYDDLRCYQVNDSPISKDRQSKYPVTKNFQGSKELPCQSPIQLPNDLEDGTLSIFWVWDYSMPPGPAAPSGIAEIYTGCADIEVQSRKKARSLEARQQNYAEMGIMPSQAQQQASSAAPSPTPQAQVAPKQSSAPSQPASPTSPAPSAQPPVQSAPAASAPPSQPAQPVAQPQTASIVTASINVQALASAVAEELGKKKVKTVTVTQTAAAACDKASTQVMPENTQVAANPPAAASQSAAAKPPSAQSSPAPASSSLSIATAVPSSMTFAPPIMAPTAASSVKPQAQTATPVQQTQSGAVQATGYGKRTCKGCEKKRGSRIF